MSVTDAMDWVNVSEHTAVDWYNFCREVCEVIISNQWQPIGGPNTFVEIDESHLCHRKYYRGKILKTEGVWVFGGVCRETGEGFAVRVPNRELVSLRPCIEMFIAPGSIVMSDKWSAYMEMPWAEMGITLHLPINHTEEYSNRDLNDSDDDEPGLIHTNTIERKWREVKKRVKSYKLDAVDKYLCEFSFRSQFLDHLPNKTLAFLAFIEHVKSVYPGGFKLGLSLVSVPSTG